MSKLTKILIALFLFTSFAWAQLSGLYTVGTGGNYATLGAALAAWRSSIITGDVTFRLLDATYPNETYPLVCTIPAGYVGGDWTLTIKPVSGTISTFDGSPVAAGAPIFDLKGVNRVTIDSVVFSNSGPGRPALRFIAGASYNTVKNSTLKAITTTVSSGVVVFSTAIGAASGNNNNTIENCDITRRGTSNPHTCINFNGSDAPLNNQNNTIKGCRIYDFSNRGISFYNNASNTTITENDIYTLNTQTGTTLNGIYFYGEVSTIHGTNITRNKIRDLRSSAATPTISGINIASGGSLSIANTIANNFIYLNADTNHTGATIYGIAAWASSSANLLFNIYYNSIYIGGTDATRPSYGLYRSGGNPITVDFRNNIIFNNRTSATTPSPRGQYGIYCAGSPPPAGLSSNYNDLFVTNAGTDSQYVGYWDGVPQPSLAAWQTASLKDTNSISLNPDFQSITPPVNLHISPTSTNVNNLGTPISGITIDFDGEPRDAITPDIGADEYTPTGVPAFSVLPASLAFGDVPVGSSKTDSVTVTNTGTAPLTISSVTSDNARFTVLPTSGGPIAPSGSMKFYITFAPISTGAQSGNIEFTHNAATSPDTVTVSGTGVEPVFTVDPTALAFDNVNVGSSKQDSVTVTNTGGADLIISSVTAPAEFSVTPTSAEILPAGTMKFYITFAPTSPGLKTGNVVFTHNAAGSPTNLPVSGTGVALVEPGWSKMTDVAVATKAVKGGGALTAMGDKVYALIGNNTNEFFVYDIGTKTWTKKADVPIGPRRKRVKKGAALITAKDCIYALKGGNTQEFYRYDPVKDSWKTMPEPGFTKGIKGGSMAFDGDSFIYAIRGSNDKEWKKFNIYTETWSPATPAALPQKMKFGSWLVYVTSTPPKIYCLRVGGKTNEFYRWTAGTWTRTTDMPLVGSTNKKKKAKGGSAGVYVPTTNRIYAMKGGNTLEFFSFNPANDSWKIELDVGKPATPAKRVKDGGALAYSEPLNGVFAFIGNNTREFWFYNPPPPSLLSATTSTGDDIQGAFTNLKNFTLNIVPNPTKNEAYIHYTLPSEVAADLKLYNILGEVVYSAKSDKGLFVIDSKRLPTGIYILRFKANEFEATRKLIITR